jgi:hypothetical protein
MAQDIKSPTGTISTRKDPLTNDSMSLAPPVCKCLTHNQEPAIASTAVRQHSTYYQPYLPIVPLA